MKRFKQLTFAALAAAGVLASAIPAEAAPEPSGWDDLPDVVIGGGSDTTYLVMQRYEQLYNATPGCQIVTSGSSADKGKCALPATGDVNGNFDHDIMVGATPTGSSAGVVSLLAAGPQYNPPIDYARSSRGPSGTETDQLTFWGFARDGIAVLTFGSRTGVSLTKQQLKDIYTCQPSADTWGEVLGTGDTSPIIPWDMNAASGTTASFKTYVDNVAFGPCVRKLVNGAAPFENDVKPVIADVGPDATPNTSDDNEDNYLWWMSFGNFKTYPYTTGAVAPGETARTESNPVTVEGVAISNATINNNTYPIARTIFHVTRNTDADCRAVPGSAGPCDLGTSEVTGANGGKGGAVREFTEWICRPGTAGHTTSITTGNNLFVDIGRARNAEGFLAVPASLRTAGSGCQIFT
jgi:ABC-type phosphate transport system substrate-binding protein